VGTLNAEPYRQPATVHVGQDVGGREYEITPSRIAHHAAGTGDGHPWYRDSSPFGGAVAPALLYHSEVYEDLSWYLPNLFGNLHARQEWELFHPMSVGQKVRTRSTVVERYRKRDRDYIVNEVLITDVDGRWLQRSRTHQSFLVEKERSGYAVDREREKRTDRTFTLGDGPGPDLEGLEKQITLEMCQAFSGPHKNYHNDREMARMLGFPDVVVQGMMSVCFVSELMTHAFGAGWLAGGKLDVRLVNVVWGGDTLVVRGRVRESLTEGDGQRVVCDVWCEKPDGTKTLVGAASAVRFASS
jgi:acyl dehydratase